MAKAYVKAMLYGNETPQKNQKLQGGKQEQKEYLDLGIIDPSIASSNLGDLIILESVSKQLKELFPNDCFTKYPSQISTSFDAKKLMSNKDLLFVSGTNLLASNMDDRMQWSLDPGHKYFLRNNVVLMGVGWWQYQNNPNKYTQKLLKNILSKDVIHSVRDSYTKDMLQSIGINNVVNTTCPTLWKITKEHCQNIPTKKSPDVVTTLTAYHKNDLDKVMLIKLIENYENVHLWLQSIQDLAYLESLLPQYKQYANLHLLPPNVDSYINILHQDNIEYVGTRLHAGIKALQNNKRMLILAVDNRAIEIGKDTGLNVIKRENIEDMDAFINGEYYTNINLPENSIREWTGSLMTYFSR